LLCLPVMLLLSDARSYISWITGWEVSSMYMIVISPTCNLNDSYKLDL